MELRLTPEQSLLRDSAAKFIATAGPKVARGFRAQVPSFAPARLRAAGELGWLGIIVPASRTGLGLGLAELALLLEQAGEGLVCEPIGLAAISAAALSQRPHPMLKAVMTGTALVVPALQEATQGDDPLAPHTRATRGTERSDSAARRCLFAPMVLKDFWSAPMAPNARCFAMWHATRPAARSRQCRRLRVASSRR